MHYLNKPAPQTFLAHHGIKGQKWGIRRFQNEDGTLTKAGIERYAEVSSKSIKVNEDGSSTVPKGFTFNRIGGAQFDPNKSGGLYVSYGKADASRYIKYLGPTPINKLLKTASYNIQHISVKEPLKMPSNQQVAKETAELLMKNKKLLDAFNESFYAVAVTNDFNKSISIADVEKALRNPNSKEGQKLSYGVSSMLGDGNMASEAKDVYKHFRDKGYDAIPDIHDRLSGTSETAMIVINPDKLQVTSSTVITKDVMKEAKEYVKSLEKLPVSELIKD